MSTYCIENEFISVKIDEHASEMISVINKKTGFEHVWQADAKYWGQHNPTLFPMVGKVFDGNIRIHDKIYHMGNHGFARHADFTCLKHDEKQVVMILKDDNSTLEQYPFHFSLKITFTLNGATIDIHYEVVNENDESMPFNFGLHPAFNCPLDPQLNFEDYHLEFDCAESFDNEGLHVVNAKTLDLNREFLKKTIIIPNPSSSKFTLTDHDRLHGTTVEAKGYTWIAFWSPDAPFVCIEPWYSHTDFEENDVPFDQREGTISLEPNMTWETSYSITVF